MSLIAEAPNFLQVYSDGSVKRFNPEIVPASLESVNGYKSKDVIIDPSKPTTGRIFLPGSPTSSKRLPLLVYFHGGGFCIGSTTWLGYHNFLGDFSVTSQSIILSVDYRLAPEHRLPIAYEDCYTSLEWLGDQVCCEPLFQQADITRVFLSGDSAGGNIAHHVAVKAIQDNGCPLKIKGLMLIHPYFGSENRTKKEMADESIGDVAMNDMFWRLSIPKGLNRDYFGCNFEKLDLSTSVWSKFPAIEVYVAGKDFLKEKGVMYVEFLKKKGVKEVEIVEAKEEPHVFHVFYPESRATRLLQSQMSRFMEKY
ncbi:carboxylesterase 17 [Spatholobus suberectus]|nr:carboxylesterase 17 [Spatholobus suberectus]